MNPLIALGIVLSDRFAALVRWMKDEPVLVRVLAALATTALAKWGVQLDGDQVLAVGAVAAAVAAWAARRKVYKPSSVKTLTDAAHDRGKAEGAITATSKAKPKGRGKAAAEAGAGAIELLVVALIVIVLAIVLRRVGLL